MLSSTEKLVPVASTESDGSTVAKSSLRVRLHRVDRTYKPGEIIEGEILVFAKDGWRHQSFTVGLLGQMTLYAPKEENSVLGFSYSMRELQRETVLYVEETPLPQCPQYFPAGETRVPFSLVIPDNHKMIETHHGANVNVVHEIRVTVDRGSFSRVLKSAYEFVVENSVLGKQVDLLQDTTEHEFVLRSNPGGSQDGHTFRIKGKLHALQADITRPFTGEIIVEESTRPVHSIDIQLNTVETIKSNSESQTGKSVVQVTQIADGDVCRGLVLPIYFIFPR
eukprot:scaffold870_cov268-Pinguiococcus_pyrenoidosus.AAC.47